MTTRYYKTTDAGVLAAAATMKAQNEAMTAAALAFKEKYGAAAAVRLGDSQGTRIGGLKFEPPKNDPSWTKRDKHSIQAPRATRVKATKEEKAAHAALRWQWEVDFPQERVDYNPMYEALGTNWSNLLFCGLGWAIRPDAVYVLTSAKLADHCVEILGSEYEAAVKAANGEAAA